MILVDASVWIDYFNGNPTWQTVVLDQYLSDRPIIMGDLVLTKILHGFISNKDFNIAKSFLNALPFRLMGGYEVAIQSAQTYWKLGNTGITVRKTIDVIIATFCIIEGLTLLHDDRDFNPISDYFPLKTVAPI